VEVDTWVWILIVVAAVLVLALIVAAAARSRRTRRLREGFGPEYDRTMERAESRREAETELREREERREQLDIRPLAPGTRDRYLESWQTVQARFVDQPEDSVREADRLVQDVMRERGYPTDDFEQRSADISVDHPQVVDNYRAAHRLSLSSDRGEASTEELRRAMVHYRSLFDELLETRDVAESAR
jgi:FtsZ-interacting cell division protein ZipA